LGPRRPLRPEEKEAFDWTGGGEPWIGEAGGSIDWRGGGALIGPRPTRWMMAAEAKGGQRTVRGWSLEARIVPRDEEEHWIGEVGEH
jgi:hypothetical protein